MTKSLTEIFLDVAAIEALSGHEKPVADYIRQFCARYDLKVEEDDTHRQFGGNSGNLICRVGGGGEIALLSHMDTARSTRDLKPRILSDRITSDGSTVLGVDNRAGIAVILYTLSRVFEEYTNPPEFTIAFTICEETTLIGSKHIDLTPVKMAFIFDSALRPGNFIRQSYGAQRFDVTVKGKAAHSGLAPENGINAIKAAAMAISNISVGRVDEETTLNIATIHGGEALNVVPDSVKIEGEVRSLTPARVLETVSKVKSSFDDAALSTGSILDFSSNWEFEPYTIANDLPVYRRIFSAIELAGLSPVEAISAGGSDANYLNAKNLPAINIGIGAQNPHANDEFILLEDLESTARIAWALVTGNRR